MNIFLLVLPFTVVGVFSQLTYELNHDITWLTIPVALMFYIIHSAGKFTENPFENRIGDTPMTALCRTIEIDAKEMLEEEDIPESITSIKKYGDGEFLM